MTPPCNTASNNFDGGDCCPDSNTLVASYGQEGYDWLSQGNFPLNCKGRQGYWITKEWGSCTVQCGGGTRFRTVQCVSANDGATVLADAICQGSPKPAASEACNRAACGGTPYSTTCPAACSPALRSNDRCDAACNNPDCSWDGGDCCPETASSGTRSTDAYPMVCQDPRHSEGHGNWRFEYNVAGGICRTPAKDQGACGAAYAFAATTAARHQMCMAGAGTPGVDLSPMHLVACSEPGITAEGNGCKGGYTPTAVGLFALKGYRAEQCYPYASGSATGLAPDAPAPTCASASTSCPAAANQIYVEALDGTSGVGSTGDPFTSAAGDGGFVPTINLNPLHSGKIKDLLMKVGPLALSLELHDSFFYHDFSLGPAASYPPPGGAGLGGRSGGHAVVLTGFGQVNTSAGVRRYWVAENSWGEGWGDRGFLYLNAEDPVWGVDGQPYAFVSWTTNAGRFNPSRAPGDYLEIENTYGDSHIAANSQPYLSRRLLQEGPDPGVENEKDAAKARAESAALGDVAMHNAVQGAIGPGAAASQRARFATNAPELRDCAVDPAAKAAYEGAALPFVREHVAGGANQASEVQVLEALACVEQVAAGRGFFFSSLVRFSGADHVVNVTLLEDICKAGAAACSQSTGRRYLVTVTGDSRPAATASPTASPVPVNGPVTGAPVADSGPINQVVVPGSGGVVITMADDDDDDNKVNFDDDYFGRIMGAVFGGVLLAGCCLMCCAVALKALLVKMFPENEAAKADPSESRGLVNNPAYGEEGEGAEGGGEDRI